MMGRGNEEEANDVITSHVGGRLASEITWLARLNPCLSPDVGREGVSLGGDEMMERVGEIIDKVNLFKILLEMFPW